MTVAYALWRAARDTDSAWEAVIAFGGLLGLGLLFVAVLSDQLKARSTDKYRSVQK